jgi:hypothetical protein
MSEPSASAVMADSSPCASLLLLPVATLIRRPRAQEEEEEEEEEERVFHQRSEEISRHGALWDILRSAARAGARSSSTTWHPHERLASLASIGRVLRGI